MTSRIPDITLGEHAFGPGAGITPVLLGETADEAALPAQVLISSRDQPALLRAASYASRLAEWESPAGKMTGGGCGTSLRENGNSGGVNVFEDADGIVVIHIGGVPLDRVRFELIEPVPEDEDTDEPKTCIAAVSTESLHGNWDLCLLERVEDGVNDGLTQYITRDRVYATTDLDLGIPVSDKSDDALDRVLEAAEQALLVRGYDRISTWEPSGNAFYATVTEQ